ncbi:MAG: hypothetical protein AB7G05_00275 [Hyphomonadaceae bacterium]
MSEGEVIEQLVEFTNILLIGVSVIFTVVSAYVVGLNYFIGSANFFARLLSFLFVTLILAMLLFVLMGAASTHDGLIERLQELERDGQLTAAGRAALANASPAMTGPITGAQYSVDGVIQLFVWTGLAFVYISLAYLTFLHRWRPDAIPVSVTRNKA